MNKNFLAFILSFAFLSLFAQKEKDCGLRYNENDVKVYACLNEQSKYKSIRAELTLKASYIELETFLRNVPHYISWQYNMQEAYVVKHLSPTEFIYYMKVDTPFPAEDRDMTINLKITHEGKRHIIQSRAVENIVPIKKNTVRITHFIGQWTITEISEKELTIVYELEVDPAGNVPAWLVNLVCTNAPAQTYRNLKKELEK